MITETELSKLTDKSSRDPEVVKLYRENDFLTAYAKHTDLRVKDDPQLAIGGDWEEYGNIQRDFLIAQGLKPQHKLLEIGCGTGRLARKIVPFLLSDNYTGIDVSREAILCAQHLAQSEGWGCAAGKLPEFIERDWYDWFLESLTNTRYWDGYDFIWAFSVFIHLPSDIVASEIEKIIYELAPTGKFYFSYVPTDLPDNTRTGLKQFKHPYSFYETVAHDLGYTLKQVPWPGRQRIALMEK